MLSRNNWLPLVVVLGLVAIFGVYVESRLSALAVLDTKLALTEKRLGSLEQSSSQQEVELRVENQKLANRLELAQGRNGLLESRLNELEKNLGRFSSRLGNEGEDGSPGSVADRLKLLEGSLGNVSQSVATLRQDNAGRAEAADTAQARILEQLAELRKNQEAEGGASRKVADLRGELAEVREQSEKTSADLRLAVDQFRKDLAGTLDQEGEGSAAKSEPEEKLAALTRGAEDTPAQPLPVFEVRASDVATGIVVLSRGSKAGIKEGELFSVSRTGEHIAFVKVVRVWADYSGAEIVELLAGNSVQPRDLVEPVSAEKDSGKLDEPKLDVKDKAPPPPPPPPAD
ncbi:MAG: hypothetical protein VCD34_08600 [Planctomycetota bacterium]